MTPQQKCNCRCHKGIYGICLYCQETKCSEWKPLFPNIKIKKHNDTRIIDMLAEIRSLNEI